MTSATLWEQSIDTIRRQIDESIFQAYDIRAEADKFLTDGIMYCCGKGYGTFLRRRNKVESGKLWVVVGGGIRLSTERIRQPLIQGILTAGVNVYDAGITSTPELYFAIPYLGADGGINITASHNEAESNGLKQVIKSQDGFITSINAEDMLEIKRTVLEGDFLQGHGTPARLEQGEITRYHNILMKSNIRLGRDNWIYLLQKWQSRGLRQLLDTLYTLEFPAERDKARWQELVNILGLPEDAEQPETAVKYPFRGLKVVIDFGNGSAGETAEVFTDLGAALVALNQEPDGRFPAHIPDPIKEKNRLQLVERLAVEDGGEEGQAEKSPSYHRKEVVGIGFDEDGDRFIFVRPEGRALEGDRALCIQAKIIVDEHRRKGKTGKPRFIGEVKFSRVVEEYIPRIGGEYIMTPTGFAYIKSAVKTIYRAIQNGEPVAMVFGKEIDLTGNRETVAMAAELSGHQMAGHEENWIFDDGALAAAKMLSAIAAAARQGKSFMDLDEEIPRYPISPEINIKLPVKRLEEKAELVNVILGIFNSNGFPIDPTDGGIIKWLAPNYDWLGQVLVRKSNTQPMLICRVEAKDQPTLAAIEEEFFTELAFISTDAVPRIDLASDDYVRKILDRIPPNRLP